MKTSLKGLKFNISLSVGEATEVNVGSKKEECQDTSLKDLSFGFGFEIDDAETELSPEETTDLIKGLGELIKSEFEKEKERAHMRFERDMRSDDLKRRELDIREKELAAKANS